MDALVLGLVLLGLTAFVAAPLYARRGEPSAADDEADAAREATRTALLELEVDRASGLYGEEEYGAERTALEGRAREPGSGRD